MANSPAEIIDLEKINLGDHAVLFYRDEVNMINTAAAYIKNSLENNEKCLYIDTEVIHKKIIGLLKNSISNFNYYLNSKQLLLLTRKESYGNPSEFDADAMIDLITAEVKKALDDGYNGLSITGELKGVVDFSGGKEEVIKYEWKLSDRIFKKYPVSALCRYNLDQFDPEVIKAAIELHDYIVWKGRLNDNPYFIDPQGYKENKIEEYEIKSWLENIDQYQKREKDYKKVISRTREELAASNQQLQAYNEEIMAMNEELESSFLERENLNNRFEKMISLVSDIENLNTISEDEFLTKILKQAVAIIPEADFGSIYTFGEKYVNFVDCVGYDLNELQKRKIKNEAFFNKNLPIEIIDTSKIKERNKDYMDGSEFKKLKKNSLNKSKEIMYLDLEVNGQKKAGISLDIAKESSREFSHNSKKLFTAFYNIASSFYKLKEYNSLQDNFTREIISSTIKMLEMYDLYTRGHSENVAELAVNIAEAMDLSKPEVDSVYWAGLVHDIGKLLIPLEVLNKEGKLTKSEYEVIKEHPVLGSNALSSSSSLKKIAKYVRHHHERWDGRGYPDGLSENEIPLVSQILCAADAWDAMRSKRTYRNSLSYEQALSEIKTNKGSQFAPKIVEAALEVLENID
mgnify:FL=1